MRLAHSLLEIERKLWTNDADYYHEALVPDAVLVFVETGVISRDTAVDAIRAENREGRKWAEVQFSDVRELELAPTLRLLTYRAAARWAHEEKTIHTLASSIYIQRADGWKLAFHQQSELPDR